MVTIRWMQPFFAFTVSLLMFSLSLAQKVCYLTMNDEIVRAPTFIYALRIYCWIDKQSSFRSIRILIIRWLKCMSEHWRGAPRTRDAHTQKCHIIHRERGDGAWAAADCEAAPEAREASRWKKVIHCIVIVAAVVQHVILIDRFHQPTQSTIHCMRMWICECRLTQPCHTNKMLRTHGRDPKRKKQRIMIHFGHFSTALLLIMRTILILIYTFLM